MQIHNASNEFAYHNGKAISHACLGRREGETISIWISEGAISIISSDEVVLPTLHKINFIIVQANPLIVSPADEVDLQNVLDWDKRN